MTHFYAPRKDFGGGYSRRVVRASVSQSPIRVRPITSLFEVGLKKYFTEMIITLRRCVPQKPMGRYLKGQGHRITLQHNGVKPISLLFEVGF